MNAGVLADLHSTVLDLDAYGNLPKEIMDQNLHSTVLDLDPP